MEYMELENYALFNCTAWNINTVVAPPVNQANLDCSISSIVLITLVPIKTILYAICSCLETT